MKDKWISVHDALPEVHEEETYLISAPVLTYSTNGLYQTAQYEVDNDLRKGFVNEGGGWLDVTHWMPLPNPPKES